MQLQSRPVLQESEQEQESCHALLHNESSELRRPSFHSSVSNRVLPVTAEAAATLNLCETADQMPGISPELKKYFLMLGMTQDSLRGWACWHTSVPVAISYFVPQLLAFVAMCYAVTGAPLTRSGPIQP